MAERKDVGAPAKGAADLPGLPPIQGIEVESDQISIIPVASDAEVALYNVKIKNTSGALDMETLIKSALEEAAAVLDEVEDIIATIEETAEKMANEYKAKVTVDRQAIVNAVATALDGEGGWDYVIVERAITIDDKLHPVEITVTIIKEIIANPQSN